MQVILQGSFRHFPADQLLTLLASCRQTGTLEVSSINKKARLFFTDGSLIHAEATDTASIEETIYSLFIVPGDTFTFSDEAELPKGVQPKALDLKAVVAEGVRRAAEWQRLIQIYPNEDVKVRVIEDPKTGAGISLKPDEFKILVKIGKGRTLAQIRADLSLAQVELYPILHRLETNGLLERIPPPGGGPTKSDVPRVGTLTSSTGKMFPLVDDLYAIGRDEKNEIVIDDGTVSTVHARIARTTQGFIIEDVQSRNGTFVNGEKIDAPRLLADGDTLRFGKVVFTFNVASQTRSPVETTPG
jgi:FHA domain-containing protein/uncharacterized protein DUF4388